FVLLVIYPLHRKLIMYNTSRSGGEGGGVNVKKWLADNKLSEAEKVFLEREIQIEELIDFQPDELADFAKDLGMYQEKVLSFTRSKKNFKITIFFFFFCKKKKKSRLGYFATSSFRKSDPRLEKVERASVWRISRTERNNGSIDHRLFNNDRRDVNIWNINVWNVNELRWRAIECDVKQWERSRDGVAAGTQGDESAAPSVGQDQLFVAAAEPIAECAEG
ncbi:hypothetical protein RFI_24676, partial [Reticulomyxa filosa]